MTDIGRNVSHVLPFGFSYTPCLQANSDVQALANPGGRVNKFLRKVGNHVPQSTVTYPSRLP